MDVAVGDVRLELRQRRARVAAVEAADRHHRQLGGQLVAGGRVGADGRGDPGVRRRVPGQQGGEGRAGGAAVEQATGVAAPGPARLARRGALRQGAARSPAGAAAEAGGRRGRAGARDRAGVRGGRRGQRVGRGAGERRDEGGHGDGDADATRQEPEPEQPQRGDQAQHQHDVPEPRLPVGPPEQREGPGGGERARDRQQAAGHQALAVAPEDVGADADAGGDRRGEGDGVVGVEDPGHQAEGQPGDHAPAEPHHQPGQHTAVPSGEPEGARAQDHGGGDQPGHLAADVAGEHPQQPGLAPTHAAADRSGLGAGQPAEAVVAEGQLEDRVVLRAADVGPRARRPQRDDRHPPATGEQHRAERDQQVAEPGQQRALGEQQVRQGEGRQDQERLQHLGQEGQPHQGAADGHPGLRAAALLGRGLDRTLRGVDRTDQQQHQQRVRVVEAEHQHGHGCQGEHRAREQPGGRRTRRTADGGVQQPHRRHPLDRLRHEDAPRREAEHLDGDGHRPQGQRGLVDGDRAGGVGGAEEQRLPRLRTSLRGRGVERVGPAGPAEAPEVQQRGAGEKDGERGPVGRYGEPADVEGPGRARLLVPRQVRGGLSGTIGRPVDGRRGRHALNVVARPGSALPGTCGCAVAWAPRRTPSVVDAALASAAEDVAVARIPGGVGGGQRVDGPVRTLPLGDRGQAVLLRHEA